MEGEFTSAVSVTHDFSMLSRVLLDGVECLLGPSVNLLAEGTGLGAVLKPLPPDVDGFFGFVFLVGLSDHTVVFGDVQGEGG